MGESKVWPWHQHLGHSRRGLFLGGKKTQNCALTERHSKGVEEAVVLEELREGGMLVSSMESGWNQQTVASANQ